MTPGVCFSATPFGVSLLGPMVNSVCARGSLKLTVPSGSSHLIFAVPLTLTVSPSLSCIPTKPLPVTWLLFTRIVAGVPIPVTPSSVITARGLSRPSTPHVNILTSRAASLPFRSTSGKLFSVGFSSIPLFVRTQPNE